jgi:hypothetical protein
MIYQLWWPYPIPLIIYPSNQFSILSSLSHPFTTHFTVSFQFFVCFLLSYSQPHVFSSICYNSKSHPLCNYDAISLLKTNLLCNPPLGSPLEVKKTFLSHSPKPFINFYYHDFHYSFAIHLPFLYVYIYFYLSLS